METNKIIAQIKIDDCATVRVLQITPEVVVKCDRHCACLEEDKNGSLQCSIGWIKNMVNFQITALIIDYEVILDRDSDWDWPVCAADFSVIDENGQIHKGEFICDHILTPERIPNSPDTLYPGTRGKFRVYYETFPKGGKVASIVAVRIGNIQGRMDLLSTEPVEYVLEEERKPIPVAPQPPQDDLRERVDILEGQMKRILSEIDSLRRLVETKGTVSNDPSAPMRDPGISYHSLENK